MIVWIFVALFAAAVNYVCTAVNFSFARMRKKYIEDNDELDAEKVEKVAPYYQKTSVVLAGTQIGYLFCSSIFALSLYQSVRHMVLFWEETIFFPRCWYMSVFLPTLLLHLSLIHISEPTRH